MQIKPNGQVVSESTFRLSHQRKEHKKQIREMLAQAIVNKAVDMERSRQVSIRKDIEWIAKKELVKRVQVCLVVKGVQPCLAVKELGFFLWFKEFVFVL